MGLRAMGSNFVDRADRSYAGALRSARERARLTSRGIRAGGALALLLWQPSTRRAKGVRRVMREPNGSAAMPRESRAIDPRRRVLWEALMALCLRGHRQAFVDKGVR